MTKRDWAHLIGWAIVVYLLWDARAFQILALDSSKRVGRLEARVESQQGEIDALRAAAIEQTAYWETLSRQVDKMQLEKEMQGAINQ